MVSELFPSSSAPYHIKKPKVHRQSFKVNVSISQGVTQVITQPLPGLQRIAKSDDAHVVTYANAKSR